jgi:hypothetical protein
MIELLERTCPMVVIVVKLSPLGTAATVWRIVPAPMIDDECGVIGGM